LCGNCLRTIVFVVWTYRLFVASEIFNGLIPTRWFSTSGVDWIFGTGAQGNARNYFRFMLSAIPASLCGAGAKWGLGQIKATSD